MINNQLDLDKIYLYPYEEKYQFLINERESTGLNQQQFRLNKINELKDYFITKIKERELMNKRLNKYIASFDYFDK